MRLNTLLLVAALSFSVQNVLMNDGTARDSSSTFNNGVLDVRNGERMQIDYLDETGGSPDPNKERFNSASANCKVAVSFGGVAARWQAMERLGIVIQVYAQGGYFDTDVEELGGDTFQLGIGLDWHMPRQGLLLTFAIAEDPLSDATPDFAAHLSVRSSAR